MDSLEGHLLLTVWSISEHCGEGGYLTFSFYTSVLFQFFLQYLLLLSYFQGRSLKKKKKNFSILRNKLREKIPNPANRTPSVG